MSVPLAIACPSEVAADTASTSRLAGWGRVPVVQAVEVLSEDLEGLTERLPFARGLGRAYGDAALPAPGAVAVAGASRADRILTFDPGSAVMRAEAGLTLAELCRLFLPRGYFTPVSPGTRHVTLGGMVAADVHGKNHHCEGTFGRHVLALTIRTGTGDVVPCSPHEHPDLFWASIGGMGLTGAILDVTFRLSRVSSPWICEERHRVRDIDEFLDALKAAAAHWPMSAGWIDTLSTRGGLGRGVLIKGRWAAREEGPSRRLELAGAGIPLPFMVPATVLNQWSVRLFNALHYRYHRRQPARRIVHPYQFFYPLDVLRDWPRLYGRPGFIQYQCVLPDDVARPAARRLLEEVSRRGGTSFLCVIKDCGEAGQGMLSFPMRGISIALDIPFRPSTQGLIDALNEIVIGCGGRIYLAKDALTRPDHFRVMERRLEGFLEVRRRWDPDARIRSAQSTRLFGW